ncbi:HIT-like protein [Clathrospora elynae]|uniref:Aprataxin-like protein n=1 Tax=Clathrospora elynae TaxID=706981 RepID=A0A6A5SP52_9PLEO|nr:HIT-like protein [Clathrospora elynae]
MAATSNGNPSREQAHDAITADEIAGLEPPNQSKPTTDAASEKRPNACTFSCTPHSPQHETLTHGAVTELMSQSKRPKPTAVPAADAPSTLEKARKATRGLGLRSGLGTYIESPETNPAVMEYDDDFVVINDKYPKASVHLLLIPRSPAYYNQHPLHVLSTDPAFLAEVRKRAARLKLLAASELRRQYGHLSASDAPYQSALEAMMSSPEPPPPPSERSALLPPGRDWAADIVVGVHTHPSMNHLHMHIFSREMHSPWLKHKKHYLSFNTGFLVQLDEFPLEKGSERFHPGSWPNWDMKCWRCGKNFKNKFAAFKAHLVDEFEGWKKE